MATSLRPLQTAVFTALSARPALTGKVYDKVPEPAPFPYVSLGSITEYPDDAHDAQGLEATVTVHAWSKAPGNGEVFDLFAEVDAALDRVSLTIAGFAEVRIRHTQHQALQDPDPDVRHINAQYRVHMTKE
ncbi:DUF3168 domain-containing protein [Streptomyces europaeiscabiei]|uniref:DUF3168 domain-containing protein n=1 Tax=Streptomyces europaeiscabiei TaxID=146819 RepID=A0ABU4N8S2_9ACTN|nr:DUF3168 domain-containing protein [Streptomyces europaeiscabiei]MDX3550983.1 DUF3168 domain-containing protein [Streptomyces europaeiscabiei]MDX3698457.1 DUF3168 domain-containing protein [Streptomyces europaeiscabiei]